MNCLAEIRPLCSNLMKAESNLCRISLTSARGQADISTISVNETLTPFIKYLNCSRELRDIVDICSLLLEETCMATHLRTAKVLRMHMKDVEGIIQKHPNLKIIHLLRDPRGIVVSRLKSNHTRLSLNNETTSSDVQKTESKYLCLKMYSDLMERRELEIKYPQVFLEVRYESMAADPMRMAEEIYEHIGETLPDEVIKWLYDSTHAETDGHPFSIYRKDPVFTANAWKTDSLWNDSMSYKYCKTLLLTTGY